MTHPTRATLSQFALGQLPEDEVAAVEEHVLTCQACCKALETVADDSLVKLTRKTAVLKAGQLTDESAAGFTLNLEPEKMKVPEELLDHPRYRLIRKLGSGGMGAVYQAEHRMMERLVAIKVIRADLIANERSIERFRREVKAAAKLDHPNIVRAFDADQAGKQHFLAMEYVDGISLDRLVAKKGPLSPSLVCHFGQQVAAGLQHAHEKGMVHRDIKPQNIVVTRNGQVKVLDFGLARLLDDAEAVLPGKDGGGAPLPHSTSPASTESAEWAALNNTMDSTRDLTAASTIIGTPDYLSPEQVSNSHGVDIRADIYSLGCTLYFLLTGNPPYGGKTAYEKLINHQKKPTPRLDESRGDIDVALVDVVAKMMAKDANDRFATPKEVAAALQPWARFSREDRPETVAAKAVAAAVAVPLATTELLTRTGAVATSDTYADLAETAAAVETGRSVKARKLSKRERREREQIIRWTFAGLVVFVGIVTLLAVKPWRYLTPSPTTLAAGDNTEITKPPVTKAPTRNDDQSAPRHQRQQSSALGLAAASATTDSAATDSDAVATNAPGKQQQGRNDGKSPPVASPFPSAGKLVIVLPLGGYYAPDLKPLHDRLVKQQIPFELATLDNEKPLEPIGDVSGKGGPFLTVQRTIVSHSNDDDIAMLVFVGGKPESMKRGSGEPYAALARKMLANNKPVAAICGGQIALGEHGLLQGKQVSRSPYAQKEVSDAYSGRWKCRVSEAGVVEDGLLITAMGPASASDFADAVIARLKR